MRKLKIGNLHVNVIVDPAMPTNEIRFINSAGIIGAITNMDSPTPRRSEHGEQAALFAYIRARIASKPEWALIHAVPNGGKRHAVVAMQLMAEGVQPGAPDIDWPVAKGGDGQIYTSLRIEMKAGDGRLRPDQKHWIDAATAGGALCRVCRGFDEARELIERYDALPFAPFVDVGALRMHAEAYWERVTEDREKRRAASRRRRGKAW